MTFSICTLGCRVNQYESRVISEQLTKRGHTELKFNESCDIYIINTCAVTAESVRKSRQMIRRALKTNLNAKVIATGCFSQITPDEVKKLSNRCYAVGNKEKIKTTIDIIESDAQPDTSFTGVEYENYTLDKPTRAREYIKIQDGCEGKCAYCIIPEARGPIRSKPADTVIEEVKALTEQGVKEIILTGIEISSYQYGLAHILKEINNIERIERISLGSLEPTLITNEFAKELSYLEKLTPHFHISVQSGCTTVLNRMRRKYNIKMLEHSLDILRNHFPNLQLTCDIIVGFPGETDEEFIETKEFLYRNRFLHAHIFPYSIRPGTVAAVMPDQVAEAVKSARLEILNKQQTCIKKELLETELTRSEVPILFETYNNGINIGHSDNYIEYQLVSHRNLVGCMINVVPETTDGEYIYARIAE